MIRSPPRNYHYICIITTILPLSLRNTTKKRAALAAHEQHPDIVKMLQNVQKMEKNKEKIARNVKRKGPANRTLLAPPV